MTGKSRGFTLIELLVVIAIIALLMAILMPALQRVKKQAKSVICQAHLKEWATIFAMYTDDNNGFFPRRASGSGRWIDVLYDYYYRDDKIRVCPMATKIKNPAGASGGDMIVGGDTFTSWGRLAVTGSRPAGEYGPAGTYGSYGINGWVYVCGQPILYGKPAEFFWKSPDAKGGSNIPMFLDCWFWCGWPDDTDTPPHYDGERLNGDEDSMQRFCINRHDGFINAAFVDYTVRRVGLKELFTLKWSRRYNTAGAWTTAGGITPADWRNHGTGWLAKFKDY